MSVLQEITARIKKGFHVTDVDVADLLRHAQAEIETLQREKAELEQWKEAIIDATIVDWIYTKEHDINPRKAVNDLLAWQVKIALDPAVSEDAAKLHAQIKAAEARAEAAKLAAAEATGERLGRESAEARIKELEQALQQFYDSTTWVLSECPTGRINEGATQEYHDALLALTNVRAAARNTDLVTHNEAWWHKSRKPTA